MNKNKLVLSKRLAPQPRLSMQTLLQWTLPLGLALIGLFLTLIDSSETEKMLSDKQSFVEMVLSQGLQGFFP